MRTKRTAIMMVLLVVLEGMPLAHAQWRQVCISSESCNYVGSKETKSDRLTYYYISKVGGRAAAPVISIRRAVDCNEVRRKPNPIIIWGNWPESLDFQFGWTRKAVTSGSLDGQTALFICQPLN